ncbi:DNA-3-methyladenine glycosylase II [Methylohalomonas lacus]|uniref:DNA-3-methyladenine glycosylase II n=1 Tax=Methylohalomonas lacus TaxID=398773 RepID=A0AAE3HKW8_9GAMM|nr:DNA-3-methyladenine glycosylase [Methylohalomonas lacus]MCS3903605.1 DNA-3-methyladenine glycosylase II [Methylohalomonas lacus]
MFKEATQYLATLDDDWAGLIEAVGPCRLKPHPEREPYAALVRAVTFQQLHGRAAEAILNRLLELGNGHIPEPDELLALDFDSLRACGFSARKIETLRGVAGAVQSGQVPTRRQAKRLDDEALIQRLISLKGIGRWTVEMLLIFTLERRDILPVDDLGVRDGYRRLKRLETPLTPARLRQVGSAWSPYRSVATWYLWQVPKAA